MAGRFKTGEVITLPSPNPAWMAVSNAGIEHRTKAPLVIVETDNIEAMEEQVRQTGGTITLPTFKFPGGRRFHFTEPAGNELAVMQVE